jgi:uncharacterized protein
MRIQGRGPVSPLAGRTVETSGVVTLLRARGDGFWIQDPEGDGDPDTSDGVFVALEPKGPGAPSVGDVVRVRAKVEEEAAHNALPRTRLAGVSRLEVVSRGARLPEPVALTDLPDESVAEAAAFWEPLEGMRVSVAEARVVSPTTRHGELAVVTRADARPGSGFDEATGQVFLRPLPGGGVDYNPERILVGGSTAVRAPVLRPGDVVRRLEGVVDFSFGSYRVEPSRLEADTLPPPTPPVSRRTGLPGDTVVATFNLENLFDTEDDPDKDDERDTPSREALDVKLAKLALAFRSELRLPDIVVVQEVENAAVLRALAERIDAGGSTRYVATALGSSDRRGIEVGFLWDSRRVRLTEAFLMAGPDVDAAFGAASPSPGREPLVGRFDVGGRVLTVVGNHLKSKGGDDPLFAATGPPVRRSEVQRKAQARAVRRFVSGLLEEDPAAWVLVAGDMNDFPFGEPGEGPDHPLAILEGEPGEARLVRLTPPAPAYTFIYEGNSEILDHLLASPSLAPRVAGVDVLHFNAAFPAAWAADPRTALRCSDHDPVEARLSLRSVK